MMLTASNHTLDKRDRGLVRTLDKLDERNVTHLGTYRNAAERDSVLPMIVDIAGFKVGFQLHLRYQRHNAKQRCRGRLYRS